MALWCIGGSGWSAQDSSSRGCAVPGMESAMTYLTDIRSEWHPTGRSLWGAAMAAT